MPSCSSPTRIAGAALLLATLGLGACRSPGATRIVGPDGSPMAHVHCGAEQGACFRLAGELCPAGYDMKPVLRGSDGNFLVRCRAAAAVAATPPVCHPPAVVSGLAAPAAAVAAAPGVASSTHAASNDRWPPATEPWPAAYPWPPPETSAGVRPAPTTPPDEVDLGY